ncbi:hypothetical protein ACSBR2_035298 [Camellia fascicularis]
MKHHLAGTKKDIEPCLSCPDEVRIFLKKYLDDAQKKTDGCFGEDHEYEMEIGFDESDKTAKTMLDFVQHCKASQKSTLNTIWKAKEREDVCKDMCRCIYANALPFNLVKDYYFKIMLKCVGEYGKGLILSSYHELRVTFLQKEVESISKLLEKYKDEWKKNGCTIMSDGWTDTRNRSITNFLVNSPRGTVFLKNIDTSGILKNAEYLFELLDSMVEEIGEENIAQIITDSASTYVKVGSMLMKKRNQLFWSPCAAHCMDLILTDIWDLPTHKDTMSKARKITVYIYR